MLPKMQIWLFAVIAVFYMLNECAVGQKTNAPLCFSKETCHQCIQTAGCAWCMNKDHNDKPRCFISENKEVCPEEFTYRPIVNMTLIDHVELTRRAPIGSGMVQGVHIEGSSSQSHSESGSVSGEYGGSMAGRGSSGKKIVQIWPQRVSLQMRINEAYRMQMKYSQAADYPVDLYYLMDLSKSMEDDKQKLSTLGEKLTQTMLKMTSNFRLGFGSFVDKVLMPYVSTIQKKLEQPCPGCAAPYGYRNHMALSTNTSAFSTEVKNASVSGNLDAPEGGFDAIMQSIACRDAIGWREQARHLLVFSTDAGFHYAGDGKLGGVIAPNDGKCHLNSQGMYTESTTQDYPSISQINQKVKENSINIIFAVTQTQHSVYTKLSQLIEGSSSVILSNDSSNVVEVVEEEYSKISSTIEMKDTASSNIKVTYYSMCKGKTELKTSKCDRIQVGDVVSFTAEILVTSCPENPNEWKQQFQIYPVGLNDALTIDLELLCSCDCERKESKFYEEKSKYCSGHGTYMCGICVCDDSYDGKECQCHSNEANTNKNTNGCRADNTTQVDCSGHGQCVCNECKCDAEGQQRFSGTFCECNNFSCERNNNLLCSGPDHGTCDCGQCQCNPDWEGSACECLKSKDACKPPNGGEICSGHGECECGACKCKSTDDGRYSGKYCENCPTCSGRCQELKHCVQCQAYQTGPLKDHDDCARNCTTFVPGDVKKIEIDEEKNEQLCMFYDEDECRFTFKYSEVGDKIIVDALSERDCPPKVFMLGIVLGVIAAIVLVGLAILLLWKLLTTIHDRREFARFEKERMNAKWDTGENPIYKQATSTFKNPSYAPGK